MKNITNVEKAKEIAENSKQYFYHDEYECGLACALRMARWKDDYYKKLLDLLVKSGANADIITNYIENCI